MMKPMGELVFEAIQEADGGYCAECLTENIFAQGDTWEELRKNVVFAFTLCEMKFCPSHQRIAIPNHAALRVGTFNSILRAVAGYKGVTRKLIVDEL